MEALAMALVIWVASDANKVNPISGNVLEEHYWQQTGRNPYNFASSYQPSTAPASAPATAATQRGGKLREKSTIWDSAKRRISLRAAGNEFVAFQVIVEKPADRPLKGVSVTVSDLAGPEGAKLESAKCAQVFVEHYMSLFSRARDAWDEKTYYGEKNWFPDGLIPVTAKGWDKLDLPEPRLNVAGQRVQGFWIDLYVPHKTKGGLYKGKVTVSADGRVAGELELQLEVLPWELPDETSFIMELNTYHSAFAARPSFSAELGSERHYAIERAFYKMAQEHRCTLSVFPGWASTRQKAVGQTVEKFMVPPLEGKGKDIKVADWAAWDKRYEPYFTGQAFADCARKAVPLTHFYLPFSLGWPSQFNQYYEDRQAYEAEWTSIFKQFADHIAAKGWKRTQFQLFLNGKKQFGEPWNTDEPKDKDEYDALRYYGQLMIKTIGERKDRQANIRYRVDIGTYRTAKDQLDGIVDLRVVNYEVTPQAFWSDMASGMLDTRQRLGDEWWHYAKDDVRMRHTRMDWSLVSPILYGWSGWDLKTQGYCLWQCMDWHKDDPFNKHGAIWSYVAMWYPGEKLGIDGPIASMRLKGFRRGLQDLEHLAALSRLKAGDSKAADAILNKYYKLANAAPYSIMVEPEDTYKMRYETFEAIQAAKAGAGK
jgi:hypothetical protein